MRLLRLESVLHGFNGLKPATAVERAFVERMHLGRTASELSQFIYYGAALSFAMLLWSPLMAAEARSDLLPLLLSFIGAAGVWLLAFRKRPAAARVYIVAVQLVGAAWCLFLMRYTTEHLVSRVRAIFSPALFLLEICGTIMFLPFGVRNTLLTTAATLAGVVVLMHDYNPGMILAVLFMFVPALGAKIGLRNRYAHLAVIDCRARLALLPGLIARRTLGSAADVDISQSFPTRHRECVCISTDLKRFDLLAESRIAELEGYLRKVYERCQGLLDARFPEGNYCADWIAGELFIVVFVEEGALSSRTVMAAVDFGRAMVEAFVGEESHVASVGLAAGTAYVGMMGSPGMRKATALGEVAGRARRMQQSAWVVEQQSGATATVVFGSDVWSRIEGQAGAADTRTVALSEEMTLRDLPDRTLHFIAGIRVEAAA